MMQSSTLGMALMSVLALLAVLSGCKPAESSRPDVILVILDTTRADHLSSYGYPRETTPNLDRLASEGERYESAFAQSSWTLPTIATLLTGLPPHRHGAGRGRDGMFGIRESVRTVAERFAAADYRTGAVINVVWCNPEISSLNRGFEHYDFVNTDASNRGHRDARATTDAALSWLGTLGDDPAFLVVHYFDPHLTYDPPAPFDRLFVPDGAEEIPAGFGSADEIFKIRDGSLRLDPSQREALIARYDGELRFMDEQFGRLREELEQMGRWNDALVVVVADHGEEFWDHGGFEHGHSHQRELLRVPLIVRRPQRHEPAQGRLIRDRVRQLDVVPTLLSAAGLEIEEELPGRPLGDGAASYSVAEGSLWAGDLVSVRSDAGAVILNRDTGEVTFPEGPVTDSDLQSLKAILEALPRPRAVDEAPTPLSEEQIETLRSLGYLR